MKMNRNEMEALYAFGCPNLKATVERLRMANSMILFSIGQEAITIPFKVL